MSLLNLKVKPFVQKKLTNIVEEHILLKNGGKNGNNG